MERRTAGLLAGVGAYVLWGLFPLYWGRLAPATPVEVLAHRVVWTVVLLALVVAVTGGFAWVRAVGRRRTGLLALAGVLIGLNWLTFIYAVDSHQVVEASLGYFTTPLVTVAFAVTLLGERLRRLQAVAVAIAAVAVAVLTVDYGRVPWLALTLAISFALYGLVKKHVGMDGIRSLSVETIFLVPAAVAYLGWLLATGHSTFGHEGVGQAALLAGAGVATAVPLMLFGAAAVRIPLTTVGLLQYLAPTMQLLIGVYVLGEALPATRLLGFGLVWMALLVFTVDALRHAAHRSGPGAAGTS